MPVEAIGYVFAYCRKRPRSRDEVLQLPAAAYQLQRLRKAGSGGRIEIATWVLDLPTNRRSVFFERRPFAEMMQRASLEGKMVAVADVAALFRTIRIDRVGALGKMLDLHGSRLWDAMRDSPWDEFSEEKRDTIIREALMAGISRGQAVKAGLGKSKRSSASAPKENAKRGRDANVVRANKLATTLRAVVEAEMEKLAGKASLSPSALASVLNDRNVPSPRGGRWSHNSAKNLLVRILRLEDAP